MLHVDDRAPVCTPALMQHHCIEGWPVEGDDHLSALCTQQSDCRDTEPPRDIVPVSYAETEYLHQSECR